MVVPPNEPTAPRAATEPVALAELVRTVIVALVSLGWITLDNATVNTVATIVGLALSWLLTWVARSKVTPVSTLIREP